ncbi:MAG: ABC transporter ATP-binding protein [Candidatus Lokiarchaeota archaeon]|nr:ABC transporter ATP-binding protein [Candidatus Lokiarchaeota archaeon]
MVLKAPKKIKIEDEEISRKYKIIAENLHKTYLLGKTAVAALRGVDVQIKEAEFIGLYGPSGSGKTTLLNLIGGLDYPTRGKIFLDGINMAKLDDNELADLRRDHIGYVFQFYNLLPLLTALENVMIPLHFQAKLSKRGKARKAMELLRLVKLDERANHTPSELSGGEQQRVAIARAFANDPSIVILDEPTGDLDSKTGIEILNLLRDLNRKGATFVTATHDGAVSEYCSRVLHLMDGKIVTGSKAEGLKETPQQRKTRLEHQQTNRQLVEEKILKTIEGKDQISIERLRAGIPSELMEHLPIHFDDIIQELIDNEKIKGELDKGVLFIQKEG